MKKKFILTYISVFMALRLSTSLMEDEAIVWLILNDGVHILKMHPTQNQNAPQDADSSISESIPTGKSL